LHIYDGKLLFKLIKISRDTIKFSLFINNANEIQSEFHNNNVIEFTYEQQR